LTLAARLDIRNLSASQGTLAAFGNHVPARRHTMATKIGVRLNGRFSPRAEGRAVRALRRRLRRRHVGRRAADGKVDRAGNVAFSGLDEGKRYWIAGEDDDDSGAASR
jgi:hypothetical protein